MPAHIETDRTELELKQSSRAPVGLDCALPFRSEFERVHAYRQRLFAWIAIIAILGAALLPSVVHSADGGPDPMLHDLCLGGATQAERAALDVGPGQDGRDSRYAAHILDHCPFCCGHPLLAVLPAQTPSIPLVTDGGPIVPRLFLVAPQRPFAWSPSLPRSPPRTT